MLDVKLGLGDFVFYGLLSSQAAVLNVEAFLLVYTFLIVVSSIMLLLLT